MTSALYGAFETNTNYYTDCLFKRRKKNPFVKPLLYYLLSEQIITLEFLDQPIIYK